MLPGQCVHTVSTVLHFPVFSKYHWTVVIHISSHRQFSQMNRLGKRTHFTPAQKNGQIASLSVVTLLTGMKPFFLSRGKMAFLNWQKCIKYCVPDIRGTVSWCDTVSRWLRFINLRLLQWLVTLSIFSLYLWTFV